MSLTRDDVKHLAELARLELTDKELESTEKELEKVLGYVERLQKIDTKNVDPWSMPAKATGFRQDVAMPVDEIARELVLSNFPSRKGDLLSTPGVFDKPKGGKG